MIKHVRDLIDKLSINHELNADEFKYIIDNSDFSALIYAMSKADKIRKKVYSNEIYLRGLIEFSNYCRNDCFYCGIRKSNEHISRYRLSHDQIIDCVKKGYELGLRSFVLQAGEDYYYTDEKLGLIIKDIKKLYPNVALTLSIGERSKKSYQYLFDCGCNRYLLRHETKNIYHYRKLHPTNMSLEHRLKCLDYLKEIGYQCGSGFMIGSPFQSTSDLVKDLLYLKAYQPEMVGVGPFIPQSNTPFSGYHAGDVNQTLLILSLIRMLLPDCLLPSTTALATLTSDEKLNGIKAGCNVIMPNISPMDVRGKYLIYDHKKFEELEGAENIKKLNNVLNRLGYKVVIDKGDHPKFKE